QAELTIESGPDAGHTHRVGDHALRMGRSPDNDVIFRDPATSGHHARLERRAEQFWVVDLGSTNGTFVNGESIQEKQLNPGERLTRACKEANAAVFNAARDNPDWAGMGSTMVIAAIRSGEIGLLNVGDSPAYLYRHGLAKLISQDHSWPAEQVRLGLIKPEEAANHPLKHRLTRAVGVWEQIQAFTDKIKLVEGDAIVLCSDGVETAGVSVEEMGRLLRADA